MSQIPPLTEYILKSDLPRKDFIQSYKHLLEELWSEDSYKPFSPKNFKVKALVNNFFIISNFSYFYSRDVLVNLLISFLAIIKWIFKSSSQIY